MVSAEEEALRRLVARQTALVNSAAVQQNKAAMQVIPLAVILNESTCSNMRGLSHLPTTQRSIAALPACLRAACILSSRTRLVASHACFASAGSAAQALVSAKNCAAVPCSSRNVWWMTINPK